MYMARVHLYVTAIDVETEVRVPVEVSSRFTVPALDPLNKDLHRHCLGSSPTSLFDQELQRILETWQLNEHWDSQEKCVMVIKNIEEHHVPPSGDPLSITALTAMQERLRVPGRSAFHLSFSRLYTRLGAQ